MKMFEPWPMNSPPKCVFRPGAESYRMNFMIDVIGAVART